MNGVVLENGEKRAKLRVKSDNANLLRLREAMPPEEATTPVKRLYYISQLIVTGDLEPQEGAPELNTGLSALQDAMPDECSQEHIVKARSHLDNDEYYQVMRALRALFKVEEKLLLLAHAKELGRLSAG